MEQLKKSVEDFIGFELKPSDKGYNHSSIGTFIQRFCVEINEAEKKGHSMAEIKNVLKEARVIHAKSPFIARLQTWPRGYQGDFETIEYLCSQINRTAEDTIEHYLEWFALNLPIAQQHRNKVDIQSNYIQNLIVKKGKPNILIVGAGSGRDISKIIDFIEDYDYNIYFNDIDEAAIEFIKNIIPDKMSDKVHFITNNIIKLVRSEKFQPIKFDLVLFGGVFDYLNDKTIKFLLNKLYNNNLTDGGKIVFTNIATGNPYRYWISFLADWDLLERSEEDCMLACSDSNLFGSIVKTYRDGTDLTIITEITKPQK